MFQWDFSLKLFPLPFSFEKYVDSDGRTRYAVAGYVTVFQVSFKIIFGGPDDN